VGELVLVKLNQGGVGRGCHVKAFVLRHLVLQRPRASGGARAVNADWIAKWLDGEVIIFKLKQDIRF